jgi:hypothetical protein
MRTWPIVLLWFCSGSALPQSASLVQGPHRMEISLQRLDRGAWTTVDPGLVLAQKDRVRFRVQTNFEGYLYVMNYSTSGKYEQLFPREETGQGNQISPGRDYMVPATQSAFRIAGPPGHEIVYWLVSPVKIDGGGRPTFAPMPLPGQSTPHEMTPRCDDEIFHARGECVDSSAGLRGVPNGETLPKNLADTGAATPRDLLFMRRQNTAVVSSVVPLTGPLVYEFRLSHR